MSEVKRQLPINNEAACVSRYLSKWLNREVKVAHTPT